MPTKYIYNETFYNEELNETRTIRAENAYEFNLKVNKLNELWNHKLELKEKRERIENNQQEAEEMAREQKEYIKEYGNILINSLKEKNNISWDNQFRSDEFKSWKYNKIPPSKEHIFEIMNVPKESFLEKIFKSLKAKRIIREEDANIEYQRQMNEYNNEKQEAKTKYENDKSNFEKEKVQYNKEIDEWKSQYYHGEKEAVERFIRIIMEESKYPDDFEKIYDLEYNPLEKLLIISFEMPNTTSISNKESYKYVKARDEIKAIEMKKSDFEEFYENIIFQITLKTINEIFENTEKNIISTIVFNGWVNGIDKANGKEFTNCIISLQVSRAEFEEINLQNVYPKECVRSLKGIFAGKLAQLSPVKPIMILNREDKRFIESKEILENIDEQYNLAEMPWEDFEQLVREVFEREFSKEGAEVQITRSSRDGGVDAIAFDPDPIRGGKFVIQAKRYNNVVPISAVRDLYGTMINEGATKGILVTTSYYGSDSMKFAKDKPLTLIDGQNLMYMLKKYGYNKVYIQLKK